MLQAVGLYPNSEIEAIVIKPQMHARVASIVSYPFSLIVNAVRHLAWRAVDPTWHAFKAKSQGHFITKKYKRTFSDASTFAYKIITSKMPIEEKESQSLDQLWQQFREHKKTCFGNSITLSYNILHERQLLTIKQLQEIEGTENFIKTAQAIQIVANSVIEIVKEKNCQSEEEQEDIDGDEEDFYTFKPSEKNGPLHLINFLELLPADNTGQVFTIYTCDLKQELIPDAFKGVMILSVTEEEKTDVHTILLEIDTEENCYILYDNDRGFYEWKDARNFLSELKKHLEAKKYTKCEVISCRL